MLKKVIFFGLAATAVATVCAVKYTADHYDEIKAKLREDGVDLDEDKPVDKTGKAPAGRRRICPDGDTIALRRVRIHGQYVYVPCW